MKMILPNTVCVLRHCELAPVRIKRIRLNLASTRLMLAGLSAQLTASAMTTTPAVLVLTAPAAMSNSPFLLSNSHDHCPYSLLLIIA